VNEDQAQGIMSRRLAALRHERHASAGMSPLNRGECPHCDAATRKREPRQQGSIDWMLNEPVARPMPELAPEVEPYRDR
jgi:hypothetical protein